MLETIFYWFFILACIFVFFFGYGIIESWIRKRVSGRKEKAAGRKLEESPYPRGNGHEDSITH